MNYKDEGKDLYQRVEKLLESILLIIISLLQFIVQIFILFFTVWITAFTKGKEIADEKTDKITVISKFPIPLLQEDK
jgi:hypothetical protein